MREELFRQLGEWNSDDSVGAIVLTGEGRAYSAGADIASFEQRISGGGPQAEGQADNWARVFRKMSKPIICAINGVAVGIGLTHTLLCDIRLAAPDARMSFRFVRLGITPEPGEHSHACPSWSAWAERPSLCSRLASLPVRRPRRWGWCWRSILRKSFSIRR